MTRSRVLVIATLVGALSTPALAQDGRARPRNPGAAAGWSGGGSPRGAQGSGPAGPSSRGRAPDGGRMQGGRGPEAVPRHAAPRGDTARAPMPRANGGEYRQPSRGGTGWRGGAYDRAVPAYRDPSVVGRAVPRAYVAPRYAPPRYTPPRYVGPRYAPPRYAGPGWYGNRGGRNGGWGRAYRGFYDPYRGWYDPYRRGWFRTHVVVTPRFIAPRVVTVLPWEPFYYRPSLGLGLYYGIDGLAPFGAVPPAYYNPLPGVVYGGVRITDAPRDAQVFVDGYYAGIVDDFDGVFQHINLEGGQHRIEIHHPGFPPVAFDVLVEPGRTITLRADLY